MKLRNRHSRIWAARGRVLMLPFATASLMVWLVSGCLPEPDWDQYYPDSTTSPHHSTSTKTTDTAANPSTTTGDGCEPECNAEEECKDGVCVQCGDLISADSLLGIYWQREKGPDPTVSWNEAKAECEGLSLCGHTDWRLPTLNEVMELFGNCEAHPFGINKEPWIDYYCDACYEPYTSTEGWGTGKKSQRCSDLIPGENGSFSGIWTSKIIEQIYSDGSGKPGNYCAWYATFNTGRIDDKCGGDYGEVSWSAVRCVHPL